MFANRQLEEAIGKLEKRVDELDETLGEAIEVIGNLISDLHAEVRLKMGTPSEILDKAAAIFEAAAKVKAVDSNLMPQIVMSEQQSEEYAKALGESHGGRTGYQIFMNDATKEWIDGT